MYFLCLLLIGCASSQTKNLEYYVRKNCSLPTCYKSNNKDFVCDSVRQTKNMENEMFIKIYDQIIPNYKTEKGAVGMKVSYITNGEVVFEVNKFNTDSCFNKYESSSLEKRNKIYNKLYDQEEKWKLELNSKQKFSKKYEKKRKIEKSKKIAENELKKENLTKSNIYLILREIDIQPEKDEFETTAEFNKRREAFLKDVRKKYPKLVFKKELVTEYDADNKILDVFVPTSYCPENYNETCVDIETTSSESKYVGKNAFNVEKLVTTHTSDTYGVMLTTNFSDVEGFNKKQYDKKVFQDFISLRNISAKTAKKLSENTALVIVGKLKNMERASKSSYTEPTINTPMEWRSSNAYINVSTTGICIANMLTKKCLVTFKAD